MGTPEAIPEDREESYPCSHCHEGSVTKDKYGYWSCSNCLWTNAVIRNDIMYRPHRGTLADSMKEVQPCGTWEELCKIVGSTNVTVERYRYDVRNGWDTHIVCVDEMPIGFVSGELKP